jgi:hypothetical protein
MARLDLEILAKPLESNKSGSGKDLIDELSN